MQLQQPFNAQAVDPTQGNGFSQLPVGKYPVVIVSSEIKPTSDNTGGLILFELQAIDGGPQPGATGPYRINLYNQSDKARQIAESQMSALCHVTGVFMLQDTAQLHGIPFVVEVKEQALTPQQVDKKNAGETVTPFTQVAKVFDMQGNEPGGRGNQQQAPAAAAPAPQQQQWSAPAAQAPTAAPAPAAGGWGGAPAQAPAQAPAAAPAAAGWQQQAPAATGGQPAWGKR